MSAIETADRPAYDVGEGDEILLPDGWVRQVVTVEMNEEVEGRVLLHYLGGTYECALNDTVEVVL
jgi:hypothetical protein